MKKMILLTALLLTSIGTQARTNSGRDSYPMTTYDCTTEKNTKIKVQYYYDLAYSTPHFGEISVGTAKFRMNDLVLNQKETERLQITITDYQDRALRLNLSKDKATYQLSHGIEQSMSCKVTPPAAVPEDVI